MLESGFSRPAGALTSLLRDIRVAASDDSPMPDLTFSAYQEYFATGRRAGYERRYFRRRARLAAQAAQALLNPGTDLGPLSDTLWSVCGEYTWALPAHVRDDPEHCHDLFAAETAHTLAETVAGLRDRLDPRVTGRVRAEIERRVLRPFLDSQPLAWEGFGNNWESVCGGATGLAALALLEDSPRLHAVVARSRKAMTRFLAGYGADGGCVEGVDYWVYGFGYFVYFAEALRERTGEDLMADPKVARIAAFPHRVALGDGAYVPFSDASERPWLPAGLLTRLAERFGTPPPATIPSFHDDHCYRWGHLSRTLAWYRPMRIPAEPEQTGFLPDAGWVVDRGRFAFAAKGGHNDEPHNHNDLGHFVLHTGGRSVLDDLGAAEYTADYFGDRRYESIYASAAGHSVPVVDGRSQSGGMAKVLRFDADSAGVRFELDLTPAYAVPGLRSIVRRFDWSRDGRLELADEVDAERPLRLEEVFISRMRPSLAAGKAFWENGLVTLSHDCPDATVDEVTATDHHGRPDTVFRLLCRTGTPAGRTAHRFVFELDG